MVSGQQYTRVRRDIDAACRACGRNPKEVVLVAVSKTVDAAAVAPVLDAGAYDFGENRPDELLSKHAAYPHARWHFIGNIQSRRIVDIVSCAHLIHSVYKANHLPKLDAAAQHLGRSSIDILLEVNISGEASKGGAALNEVQELLSDALMLPALRVCGLMTMAPQGDRFVASECFADLRALRDSLNVTFATQLEQPLVELSMGMSEDWAQAIEQGSTIVRIGRAVFSEDFS